jgi:ribosomal protein S18 acetylase RimI-like enzyme
MDRTADSACDVDYANFRLGNEVFEAAGATFVRNRELRNIYDANHVSDITARTPGEIEQLLATTEREFGHCGHRRFDVDHRTPPEFVARVLLDGGYTRTDALVLLLEGNLHVESKKSDISPLESEADWDAYWELLWLDWKESEERRKSEPKEEVARMMWRSHRNKQPPVQYFLAYVAGKAVAYFNSWAGVDGVGQVEDLFTHPDYRNRGIATALIHHCVGDARAKGARDIVIVADPTDTPKNLYTRMGFRPVAVCTHYLKKLDA